MVQGRLTYDEIMGNLLAAMDLVRHAVDLVELDRDRVQRRILLEVLRSIAYGIDQLNWRTTCARDHHGPSVVPPRHKS